MLGTAGLMAIVDSLGPPQRGATVGRLMDRLTALAPGSLFSDDVTVLAVRRSASKPVVSIATGLRSTWLIASRTIRSLLPGASRLPAPLPEVTVPNILGAFIARCNRWRSN
jgi:hypothetical protein